MEYNTVEVKGYLRIPMNKKLKELPDGTKIIVHKDGYPRKVKCIKALPLFKNEISFIPGETYDVISLISQPACIRIKYSKYREAYLSFFKIPELRYFDEYFTILDY